MKVTGEESWLPADSMTFFGVFLVCIGISKRSEILPPTIEEMWYAEGLAADPRWMVHIYRDPTLGKDREWESFTVPDATIELDSSGELCWYGNDDEEDDDLFFFVF